MLSAAKATPLEDSPAGSPGFYAFCSRSHAYQGLVGCSTCWCTQVHASRTTQPPNLKPFQKASQSIYASRHNRNNQFTNSKPYYHCKQNDPTAKPKAILESFAKHIHVYVCRSTQAEQPKSQTRSQIIVASRTTQPPNPKPFWKASQNIYTSNPSHKLKAILSLQAEQPNRQT